MTTSSPARLHILIAHDAPTALVIRRGPAKRVCTFSWDRKNDLVTLAQWMTGRIYERRCDLSPDGRHWIYFAMNGQWSSQSKGAWTAVASAPWLKARIFLPKGDCWQGGGLFLDDSTYWVNGGCCHTKSEQGIRGLKENKDYTPPEWYGGECLTGYYNRLQRDGWLLTSLQSKRNPHLLTVFEKRLPKGWTLQKICKIRTGREQGKAIYFDEHTMVNDEGELLTFPSWEWAEWVDGHVTFAQKGCLYRCAITSARNLGTPALIHDFNPYTFEAQKAPY
jgi:hypothetical protein